MTQTGALKPLRVLFGSREACPTGQNAILSATEDRGVAVRGMAGGRGDRGVQFILNLSAR